MDLIINYNYSISGGYKTIQAGYIINGGFPNALIAGLLFLNSHYKNCGDGRFLTYLNLYSRFPNGCSACDSSCSTCLSSINNSQATDAYSC